MTDEADIGARSIAASATPVPQPTPVIPVSQSSTANPPGTAVPPGPPELIGPPDHPEYAVGAAFAGGLVIAMILKRITN